MIRLPERDGVCIRKIVSVELAEWILTIFGPIGTDGNFKDKERAKRFFDYVPKLKKLCEKKFVMKTENGSITYDWADIIMVRYADVYKKLVDENNMYTFDEFGEALLVYVIYGSDGLFCADQEEGGIEVPLDAYEDNQERYDDGFYIPYYDRVSYSFEFEEALRNECFNFAVDYYDDVFGVYVIEENLDDYIYYSGKKIRLEDIYESDEEQCKFWEFMKCRSDYNYDKELNLFYEICCEMLMDRISHVTTYGYNYYSIREDELDESAKRIKIKGATPEYELVTGESVILWDTDYEFVISCLLNSSEYNGEEMLKKLSSRLDYRICSFNDFLNFNDCCIEIDPKVTGYIGDGGFKYL